ncbi:hypothetical protein HanIR_Chr09g0436191 [Helianthus annuus]|nr:hypothetical protein HanIR_Chr09g0436191 [Helianthus annuus]
MTTHINLFSYIWGEIKLFPLMGFFFLTSLVLFIKCVNFSWNFRELLRSDSCSA